MKLVIFDCDGTLVDSQQLIVEAMTLGLQGAGLAALPREAILSIVGLSLPQAVRTLLPDHPADVVAAVTLGYSEGARALREGSLAHDPLYEGMAAVVDTLAQRDDVLLGIATGKSIRGVERILHQLGWHGRFVTIQTADTNPSKPHPAMIETAMREAGADAADTIMIGDTTFDMRMARNAGVAAVAVAWGYHPLAALQREGADAYVLRTADLLATVDDVFENRRSGTVGWTGARRTMTDQTNRTGIPRSCADDAARQLPKRFYAVAAAVPRDGGFAVELDGRPLKTPKRAPLLVATEPLAAAIAAEWNVLAETIDPTRLPLTKIANTAIDGVVSRPREVHDDLLRFIGNDLLFYRAASPAALVARHSAAWDPVLEWFTVTFDTQFRTTTGVMPIEQDIRDVARVASALSAADAFSLAALHVITTLTGSALLTIAHLKGRLSADAVWQAAHIDEDWQNEQWGADAEAAARRGKRRAEFDAAVRLLRLAATN